MSKTPSTNAGEADEKVISSLERLNPIHAVAKSNYVHQHNPSMQLAQDAVQPPMWEDHHRRFTDFAPFTRESHQAQTSPVPNLTFHSLF